MAQISFQIMSDLHLETPAARPSYKDFAAELIPQSPYLALLGDIGYACDSRLYQFLEAQLQQYEIVFFLLGNHEAYDLQFQTAKEKLQEFAAKMDSGRGSGGTGRFVLLDQIRFDVDESVTVLGCTLFSFIPVEQEGTVHMFVTDFSRIQDWHVEDHNMHHESDVEWLEDQVDSLAKNEPERTIIIFTHHSPTIHESSKDPKQVGDASQVSSAFSTDLSKRSFWTSPQVKLWAFGHTHFNCDFEDPQTGKRVFTNQKGYRRSENETFDAQKVVTIVVLSGKPNLTDERRRAGLERPTKPRRCMVM